MSRVASERLRPWLGSAALHLLILGAILVAAINWGSRPPAPPQVAIEGHVVRYEDLPRSVRSGRAIREPVPVAPTPPKPQPAPEPRVEPPAQATPAPAEDAAKKQQEQQQQL